MVILFRSTLRNVFAKPLRTALLLLCIAFCAFAAMLSIDMTGSMEGIVRGMFSQVTGTADLILMDSMGFSGEDFAEIPNANALLVAERADGVVELLGGTENAFHVKNFSVSTCDLKLAGEMRLMPAGLELMDGEAYVSEKLSESFGWKAGDSILLHDDAGEERTFAIKAVLPSMGLSNGRETVFVNENDHLELGMGEITYATAYVDVMQAEEVPNVMATLEKSLYRAQVSNILDGEELKVMTRLLSMIFLLMFSVCFLLVIFVTVSVSQRVISERMSVVGTFRSLGLSQSFTTGALLLESCLYGVLGGVAGCLFYASARDLIFGSLIQTTGTVTIEKEFGKTALWVYLAVILGAALVECICSAREVLRASKVAIRDIIFDNQDTKYRLNKGLLWTGMILLILSVILRFWKGSVPAGIGSFVTLILAVSLLFPLLLVAFGNGLAAFFEKRERPVARLAALECFARKSTVGSGVLCVTATALALMLFTFRGSLEAVYDIHTYDADLILSTDGTQKAGMFSYLKDLPGVTDVEMIYKGEVAIRILDQQKKDVNVFGMEEGGFRHLTGIRWPDKDFQLASENGASDGKTQGAGDCLKGVFYADKALADSFGIAPGDSVSVTFGAEDFLPITKELVLAGYVDSYQYDTTSNAIVISKELYVDIFHDKPSEILICCEDAEAVREAAEKYSGGFLQDVRTRQETVDYWQEKGQSTKGMMLVLILLGIGLSMIGMISNELIGFEGRKRECAVLISNAMTRSDVARMFVLESFFLAGISILVALPASLVAYGSFLEVFRLLMGPMEVTWQWGSYLAFMGMAWLAFTAVALFPIRSLNKMNVAMQMRYE